MEINSPTPLGSTQAGSAVSSGSATAGGDGQNVTFDSVLKSFLDQPGLTSAERMETVMEAAHRSDFGVKESEGAAVNDVNAIIQSLGIHDQNMLNVGAEWLNKMNGAQT